MAEREELEKAVAALEAQRDTLGDEAVDAALAGLRQKLATIQGGELPHQRQTGQEPEDQAAQAPYAVVEQSPVGRQSTGRPPAERRTVTVLFCDVADSTALAEKLDPEIWANIMSEALELMTEPVDRFGGTVARMMGDAILAFFGAPVAHEDDPQRAVGAGLAIVEGIRPFREALRRNHGLEFNVRVGINTGLVVTGDVGSEQHGEFTAMGDAVNLAARMEQTAAPGTVQIAEGTYKLVVPLFEFQPLGGITIRGKSRPIQTYRVLRPASQPGRVRGLERHGIRSPLVGRRSELAQFEGALEHLVAGRGGILAIIGEAGVGKSRLVAEVKAAAPLDSLRWLEGRTLSYGQTISYWPFQEILWSYTGIEEEDGEAEAWRKLEASIWELFGDKTGEVLPYLASLLSLEVQETYVEQLKYMDGEAMGRQIYLAARRFFKRLARSRPTLLLFEDLHWADESSVLLLEHLLPLAEQVPLLLCVTSRPERESAINQLREIATQDLPTSFNEIVLSPLSQSDSSQLIHNLLEIDGLPSSVRATIVLRASGNPFFLEEIIRALIDTGAVAYDPDSKSWRATSAIEAITIPDTVQGVIMARVDRLEEDVKRILQTAAVVGRTFFYRVLEAVADMDRELMGQLDELEQVQFIRRKQVRPELEYIFKHALAQEVTYQSILLERRRALHARVGLAIETLFGERPEEFFGLLAYHYAQAEIWEKAQEYLFKAGDQAGQVAADAEALAHYQQALAAYERAFGDSWDPTQRAVLARKMGEAHFRRGEHEPALEQFGQAFALLGRPPFPTSPGEVRLAIVRELISQFGHRLLPGLFVRRPVEPVLAVEEEARIHNLLGWIFLFTDRERFLWASLRRLNFAEQSGYTAGAASGGAAFAVVWDLVPLLGLARRYHRRAVKLAELSGHPNALGISNQAYGFHLLNLGLFDESITYVRRSEEVLRKSGDLHGLGQAVNLLGFNNYHQGNFRQAMEFIDQVIPLGQDGGDRQLVSWGLISTGLVQSRMGLLEEAVTSLMAGIVLAEEVPDHYWTILAYAWLGQSYLWQGELTQAIEACDEGERVHVNQGIGGPALYYLRSSQLEAFMAAADQGDGEVRTSYLDKAGQARKDVLRLSRAYHLFLAEAFRLNGSYEWLRGKSLAAVKSWEHSLEEAQKRGQRYDLAKTYLEMGQRLGDQEHQRRGKTILSEIGVEGFLERAAESPLP